jgi:hypothetical protein
MTNRTYVYSIEKRPFDNGNEDIICVHRLKNNIPHIVGHDKVGYRTMVTAACEIIEKEENHKSGWAYARYHRLGDKPVTKPSIYIFKV